MATTATKRAPMDSMRKIALVAGVLYLITFISSIPAVFLLGPVLSNPNYIVGAGADTQVIGGAFLDLVNAIAAIGTAVALFSVVRRQNEGFALGFVTAIRRLGREARQVLDIPRTIGITEIQRRVASIIDEVNDGRPTTIYSSGKFVAVLIAPTEYYRLRRLSRMVAWFVAAGLDLATADGTEIVAFVKAFRDRASGPGETGAMAG
jgi:prevent-host-death family protein